MSVTHTRVVFFFLSSRHHYRRGGQWLTCRTHASLHGYGNVSVSVSIDKAHLHKDLRFEYVEDPSITKIEPEWSIYRYSKQKKKKYGLIPNKDVLIKKGSAKD